MVYLAKYKFPMLRVGIFTWNVGGSRSLNKKIVGLFDDFKEVSDLIVIGLQEAGISRKSWKKAFQSQLGAGWNYVEGESYGGMRIFAYSKLSTNDDIRFRSGMRVGVGVATRFPNKGAVAIEVDYGPQCRICFCSAHLSAGENAPERNSDITTIQRRMYDFGALSARYSASSLTIPLIHRYDHVFFFGDLNYRLDPPCEHPTSRFEWVKTRIDKNDISSLMKVDQLLSERSKFTALKNFEEASISFSPTYKLNELTNEYNMLRTPSFTDRILWHSMPSRSEMVQCLNYKAKPCVFGSDHRPVWATLQIKFPSINISRPLKSSKLSGLRLTLDFQKIRILPSKTLGADTGSDIGEQANERRNTIVATNTEVESNGLSSLKQRSYSMTSTGLVPIGDLRRKDSRKNQQYPTSYSAGRSKDRANGENGADSGQSNPGRHSKYGFHRTFSDSMDTEEGSTRDLKEKSSFHRFHREFKMEVYGHRVFLLAGRCYKATIPYNGSHREERGSALPAIPLVPINNIDDVRDEHIVLVIGKIGSPIGHSGVLPLSELITNVNKSSHFRLELTKYGIPGRRIEGCVKLVVSDNDLWVDGSGAVVRNSDGSEAKNYSGELALREESGEQYGSEA